jgi:hypothetical protein
MMINAAMPSPPARITAQIVTVLAVMWIGCSDAGTDPTPTPPATLVPAAQPGKDVTDTSFTASWTAVTGATSYSLDVSADSLFGSFLPSFNDRNVGNVYTYSVTGLTTGVRYFYRVRAVTESGTSANSNTVGVTALAPPAVSFQNDIKPIFQTRGCLGCHGGSGGLFLDTVPTILTTGNHQPVVIPGNSSGSILIQKLGTAPPFGARMPQGGQALPATEIHRIAQWIDEGAHDN